MGEYQLVAWWRIVATCTLAVSLSGLSCKTPESPAEQPTETTSEQGAESSTDAHETSESPEPQTEGKPSPARQATKLEPWACADEQAASRPEGWLRDLLAARSPKLADLLENAQPRRIQILVGEVVPTEGGAACVRYSDVRLDAEYIYPASAIKTVGAIAALERVEQTEGWSVDSPVRFEPLALDGLEGHAGLVGKTRIRRVRTLLEDTLVVSSNEAFNGLYDIAGRDALNESSWEQGLETVRLHHRLGRTRAIASTHRWVPPVQARLDDGWTEVHAAEEAATELPPHPVPDTMLGEAYIDAVSGERVDEPMDFSDKNSVSLADLLAIVAAVARPDITGEFDLGLDKRSRELLLEFMEQRPTGDDEADMQAKEARFKPLSPGVLDALGGERERFRYVNKAGRAYGFHLDAAYIEGTETGRAFFVAAAIWANENRVLNDNEYEYETVSYPFLVELGRVLAQELLVEQ